MGGKQGGKGKHVCLCLAGLMLLVSACAVVSDRRREGEARELVARASEQLARGDYPGASSQNQRALEVAGGKPPGDQALFGLGLVYAHAGNPERDYGKSLDAFKRIVQDFPQSALASQARIWVGLLEEQGRLLQNQARAARENDLLLQENLKLKQVIEKSKRVDIEIEQKKRERER